MEPFSNENETQLPTEIREQFNNLTTETSWGNKIGSIFTEFAWRAFFSSLLFFALRCFASTLSLCIFIAIFFIFHEQCCHTAAATPIMCIAQTNKSTKAHSK